jgi:hypothetical protein
VDLREYPRARALRPFLYTSGVDEEIIYIIGDYIEARYRSNILEKILYTYAQNGPTRQPRNSWCTARRSLV